MVALDAFSKHRNLPDSYGNGGKLHGQPIHGKTGKTQPGQMQPQPGIAPNIGQPPGANLPSCSQDPTMWYCYGFGETYGQSYNGDREWGNDNDTPFHTPLYLPYGGTVTDASYHGWGGQVGVSSNVPGHGSLIEYIQHLDLIDASIIPGMPLQPGTYLGLSGGQIGYGYHPEDPKYTSGPHTEFGFGAPWVNGAQGCQPGASCNPNSSFMFNDARAGNLNGSISGGPGTPGGGPCIGSLCLNIDPCTWPIFSWFCPGSSVNWTDILIRVLLVVVGAILIIAGATSLVHSDNMDVLNGNPQQQNTGTQTQTQPKESSKASEGAESSEVEDAAVAA